MTARANDTTGLSKNCVKVVVDFDEQMQKIEQIVRKLASFEEEVEEEI